MTKPLTTSTPQETPQIPEELALQIRHLAHDLSNALEVIVQASYLLNMSGLKEPATEWLKTLDNGVNKALDLNIQIREFLKKHSAK